jgi:HSP20 family molecular chaperone IbpA
MTTRQLGQTRGESRGSPETTSQTTLREQVPLRDLSDCLLSAYDGVSRRAFKLYRARGSEPGTELKDWKAAERDLLSQIPVDIAECGENLYALASVPGYAAAELSVAIEDRWMLVSGYGNADDSKEPRQQNRESSEPVSGQAAAKGAPSRATGQPACHVQDSNPKTDADDCFQDCAVRRPFCVIDLGVRVDPARSIAVLANGLLAIRMAKVPVKQKCP